MIGDGFCILKVGPELTFALREILYALDLIATELSKSYGKRPLYETMEKLMVSDPRFWQDYYIGSRDEQYAMRHYSFSDRIRYYWEKDQAVNAVNSLARQLDRKVIGLDLFRKHLPFGEKFADAPLQFTELVVLYIKQKLCAYTQALL